MLKHACLAAVLLSTTALAQAIQVPCDPVTSKHVFVPSEDRFSCRPDLLGGAINTVEALPARALNTTFKPSTTRPVWVQYTVEISCTATLAGGQSGTVQLLSDGDATPTTVRGSALNANSVSLAIALTAVNTQRVPLSYMVPANHTVRLASSGTCAVSLVSSAEVAL